MPVRASLPDRYIKDYGTLLYDFSTTDWGSSNADGLGSIVEQDTTHVLTGDSGLKGLKPVGEGRTSIFLTGLTLDLTGVDSLSLWFWFEGTQEDARIEFQLKTDGSNYFQLSLDSFKMFWVNGWNCLTIPIDSMTEALSPDISNITQIHIRLRDSSTGSKTGDFTVYLDSIYKDVRTRPLLTIIFDDGTESSYTEAFAYMYTTNGLLGSAALITNNVAESNPASLSLAECQEMYAAGWEICNHGATGENLTTQGSVATYIENANKAKNYISDNGMSGSEDIYMYGGCETSTDLIAAMNSNGYRLSRVCADYGDDLSSLAGHTNDTDLAPNNKQAYLGMIWAVADHVVADVTAYFDRIESVGGYGILILHNILASGATGNNIDQADFRAIIDDLKPRVDKGKIELVSFNTFLRGL